MKEIVYVVIGLTDGQNLCTITRLGMPYAFDLNYIEIVCDRSCTTERVGE